MLQMRKLGLKLVKRPAQVYEYHAQVIALQPTTQRHKETSSGLLSKIYVTKGLFERIHSGTKRK